MNNLLILFHLVFLLAGCSPISGPTAHEIAGEYIYKYPTGEVEVWILHEDHVYRQEFYSDVKAYSQHAAPLFENPGTWSHKKDEVTMYNPKLFYSYGTVEQVLKNPKTSVEQTVDWCPPHAKEEASMVVAVDINYILIRVKNRDKLKDRSAK